MITKGSLSLNMSAIFGVKTNNKKKRLIIFFKYVSVVSIGINVLVCKTSPISHTVASDLDYSLILSDLSL